MKDIGIVNFLTAHASTNPVSFHMPGHKGAKFYRKNGCGKFMKDIADCDITEIPGADNLFQAEGIIEETAGRYAELYDAEKSYLLINGTSSGLIASILATVPKGGKLIMARNCHKSVFNALTLGDITPVYAYPDVVFEYGVSGALPPEEIEMLLYHHPDASAVILPSPNYYGICSDIRAIAEIVHKYGKVLIVDQAHGAHLKFFSSFGLRRPVLSLPLPAEECGADIVVNSIHKTLGSFTQSAVLNVTASGLELPAGHIAEVYSGYLVEDMDSEHAKQCGQSRINLTVLEDKLQAIQSTSPSYLLMASLDVNADIIDRKGRKLFADWRRNIIWFFRKAATIPELRVMTVEAEEKSIIAEAADKSWEKLKKIAGIGKNGYDRTEDRERRTGSLDNTKINIDMSAYGIDGNRLEEMLRERGIYPELVTGNIVMLMTGIGNRRRDFKRLYRALGEIADQSRDALVKLSHDERIAHKPRPERTAILWTQRRPLHDIPEKNETLPLEKCAGRICAVPIIPYPPGIPLVCPGEEIGQEEILYIKYLRRIGDKVIGVNGSGEITVGR